MYHEYTPPSQKAIAAIWEAQSDVVESTIIAPDGCMDIVATFQEQDLTELRVVGTMTQSKCIHLEPRTRYLGIRFQPGFVPHMLRTSAHELRDQTISLHSCNATLARNIRDVLSTQTDYTMLLAKLNASALHSPVASVAQEIMQQHGNITLQTYASTPAALRKLERAFRQHVGISPKHFARIMRVRHARELIETSAASLASIAAQAGFYDQAHLTRELRTQLGCTPAQLRQHVDFVQNNNRIRS